jgi:hypothetical protein
MVRTGMGKNTDVYEFCKMFQSLYSHYQWDYNENTQNITLSHLSLSCVLCHTLKDTRNEQSYINTHTEWPKIMYTHFDRKNITL